MQDDEREALISIYEGDEAFKQVNPQTFQYKVSKSTFELSRVAFEDYIYIFIFICSMGPRVMSTLF